MESTTPDVVGRLLLIFSLNYKGALNDKVNITFAVTEESIQKIKEEDPAFYKHINYRQNSEALASGISRFFYFKKKKYYSVCHIKCIHQSFITGERKDR